MRLSFLEEPELQFGTDRHIDIRFGIMNYGPLDFESTVPRAINLGIVGSNQSTEGIRNWLKKCQSEIPAKPNREDPSRSNKQPNLFTRFPGFNLENAFRSTIVIEEACCRPLS